MDPQLPDVVLDTSTEADDLEREIWRRLEGATCLGDAVVTHCCSLCRNQNGDPQPFIRILCTDQDEIRDLVRRLRGLADIEVLALQEFVPKEPPAEEPA